MIRGMPSKIDSNATLNDGEEVLNASLWRKPCRMDKAALLNELKSLEASWNYMYLGHPGNLACVFLRMYTDVAGNAQPDDGSCSQRAQQD